jgi:glutathione S-transferase
MPNQFRLITIPVSHYCEKVRWGLDYLQLPFQELPHMPPFHRQATGKYGGESTPVLIAGDGTIVTDSTQCLRYLDKLQPGKLYPIEPNVQALTTELELLFNQTLGVHTRRWGYSYILTPKLVYSRWTVGVPLWEKLLFPIVFPKIRSMVQAGMDITDTSAAESFVQINKVLARVGEVLSDGRKYLLGDRFSAIDITFAALAAPILQPQQAHIPPARLDELPTQMQSEIRHCQATPAGEFGLRMYREHRHS